MSCSCRRRYCAGLTSIFVRRLFWFSSGRPWVSLCVPEQHPNKVKSNTGSIPAQYGSNTKQDQNNLPLCWSYTHLCSKNDFVFFGNTLGFSQYQPQKNKCFLGEYVVRHTVFRRPSHFWKKRSEAVLYLLKFYTGYVHQFFEITDFTSLLVFCTFNTWTELLSF